MTAGRALMTGLVDYAGLFPPAGLPMLEAVRRYREYLAGEDRWALGRFVVPAARLSEFSTAFAEVCCGEHEPVWGLSILGPGDWSGLTRGAVAVESVEVKAGSMTEAERELAECGGELPVYVEFDLGRAAAMLPTLARAGARAKIRTGGVTAGAIPSVEAVAGFLVACARARVPFKATAGLHHAVRGAHKLTYEAESAEATMHGFANVFLAAALAWRGEGKRAVTETLGATEFHFGPESVRWLGRELSTAVIAAARREFAISDGSCSFEEPLAEAKALGWV